MVTIREEASDEEGSDDAGPDCKFLEMWLGGEFGVVISWEMMLKNSREKEKKKGEIRLTFHFSVFFFSMDTDAYSKVYSEVRSSFSFSFSSFLLFLLPLLERKSRGKRKKKIAKDNLEKKEKKRKRKLIIENSSL